MPAWSAGILARFICHLHRSGDLHDYGSRVVYGCCWRGCLPRCTGVRSMVEWFSSVELRAEILPTTWSHTVFDVESFAVQMQLRSYIEHLVAHVLH